MTKISYKFFANSEYKTKLGIPSTYSSLAVRPRNVVEGGASSPSVVLVPLSVEAHG